MIEKLKRRREALSFQREQLAANLHAAIGGIQVLDELIAEEEKVASAASQVS